MIIFIIAFQILRVYGSSGHELDNKNLQNKQVIGSGVPTNFLMLKLVKEIESVLTVDLTGVYFHPPHFLALSLLFMKKDDDPLSMGSG